ncbi:MAG: RNA polymerase sigma factor [Solirubrobacteraceae bacterium]|nr:RNA polymerase sigma factor [Patulibacter sp.]
MPRPTDTTDEQLLARSATGDERAFEAFYRRYQGAVLGYFLRRAGSRELAFDLAAETFAAVAASIDRFDAARGSAVGWLFGIASNVLLKSLRAGRVDAEVRRRLGYQAVSLDDHDLERVEELASLSDESRLVALLERLPVGQRDAILARVVEERSYGEIAASLQCSEAVVRQRVKRGLGALRARMEASR